MIHRLILAGLGALAFMSPASAAIITVSGTVDSYTRFFRPEPDNSSPPSAISLTANGVGFRTVSFGVTQTGPFDIQLTTNFDAFLGIYSDVFDPARPLDNAMSFGPMTLPMITLLGGKTYFAVTTGQTEMDGGQFLLTVEGPGELTAFEPETFPEGLILPVPEPASWALMIAGFSLIGATLRQRESVIAVARFQ